MNQRKVNKINSKKTLKTKKDLKNTLKSTKSSKNNNITFNRQKNLKKGMSSKNHKKLKISQKKKCLKKSLRISLLSLDKKFLSDKTKVSTYCRQIFNYYKKNEKKYILPKNWLNNQKEINQRFRGKIIDYFIFITLTLQLQNSTLFLAINILDKYLFKKKVKREEIPCIFVAILFTSCKFEEVKIIRLKDLKNILEQNLENLSILKKEYEILNEIGYNIIFPSPYDFLKRLHFVTNSENMVYKMSCFFLEIFSFNAFFNCFTSSQKSISCFLLALEIQKKRIDFERLKNYFDFNFEKITEIKRMIFITLKFVRKNEFKFIFKKYGDDEIVEKLILNDRFIISEFFN